MHVCIINDLILKATQLYMSSPSKSIGDLIFINENHIPAQNHCGNNKEKPQFLCTNHFVPFNNS